MSGVEAGIGIGRTSARAAVSAPGWIWAGIALGVVGLVAVYCHVQDSEVPDYLDPNQPPINAPADYSTSLLGQYATAPGQPPGGLKAATKYLWNSLAESPCCWVGDC